jgi:hypothetical protein
MSRAPRTRSVCVISCVLAACAQIASADVTTLQRISIDGIGGMKIADMSGTTTTIISGERSRTESNLQMQSKLVQMFARSAASARVDIVRLDLGKVDHLDVAKKEYSETTFEQLRAQLQNGTGAAGSGQRANAPPQPTPIDDSQCEWSNAKADVKRTGETATLAGYDAERLTITASQACRDKQSGQVCEFVLSLDEWLAPKFAASAEAQKYTRAYAQKMGLGTATSSRDIAERAQSMFGRYPGIWSEIASKSKDMKGYPLKTTFAFAVGGPQCQSAPAANASTASPGDSTANPPPASPATAAGQLGDKIAGLFHKKSDSAPPADADSGAGSSTTSAAPVLSSQPAPLPDGMVPVITMTAELVSVSTAPVDPSVFEIPADFKKVER